MMYSKTLVAQTVKNLPTMQGTQVRSMGREDALEKGMATHSSILVCATPWSVAHQATLQEVAKSQIQLSAHTHTHTHTTNYVANSGYVFFTYPLQVSRRI